MKIALIQDSVVKSVVDNVTDESVVQDFARTHQAVIDITEMFPSPDVGWLFTPPTLTPPQGYTPTSVKITKLGFRQRFTFGELCALTAASQSSNAQVATPLQVLLQNLAVATFIDLKRPDTVGGLNLLLSLGLITADRVNTILNAPLTSVEAFKE